MTDIVEFLRARYDEDEHFANEARLPAARREQLLREVEAKRRIVELYENALSAHQAGSISQRNRTQDEAAVDVLGEAVRALAAVFDTHPDYREEWRL